MSCLFAIAAFRLMFVGSLIVFMDENMLSCFGSRPTDLFQFKIIIFEGIITDHSTHYTHVRE